MIAGKVIDAQGIQSRFAFARNRPTIASDAFKQALAVAGVMADTPVTVLCDGDAGLWRLQQEALPEATVVLDWWHAAVRFEHALQAARGLGAADAHLAAEAVRKLERAKWRLWHGRWPGCRRKRGVMPLGAACVYTQHSRHRASGTPYLGIGPQIRPHNERRFSVPWTAPAPRLREYVQALRAIWTTWETGEKLDFRGKHFTFTLMPPYFMPPSTGQRMVPITLAAVGEHSLRLAGEVADGVRLHGFCTRRYLEDSIIPLVRQGMARTGRTREKFEITGGGFVATGKDAEATARAFEIVRGRVAFYGSTPGYWGVLELHGQGDLGRELNAMSKAGQWNAMAARVPDDLVHLFAAVGTHAEIAGRIAEKFGGLSDAVNLRADSSAAGGDVPPDVIQEIKRIATPFGGYQTPW